jgi:anthranilate synthase component 1
MPHGRETMRLQHFPDKAAYRRLAGEYNVIPVCVEALADTDTPVSLLRKLDRRRQPLFLFESVEGGERWGRYSFLGFSAYGHVRVLRDEVRVSTPQQTERVPHRGAPFTVLRELMQRFRPAEINGLPRFWGGLVGYLSYESVCFFERIPCRLDRETPLAHFVIPDSVLAFDNIRHTLLAIALTFPQNRSEADDCYAAANRRIDDLLQASSQPLPSPPAPAPAAITLRPVWDEAVYREAVKRTKAYITSGEIIQAVISQVFACPVAPDLWQLYRAQRYINPSPYLFFVRFPETALVGSSPETMVRFENGVATLRPIAGTRPRGNSEQEDRALADELLSDEKERAEHLMLVDLGRNDLGRVAVTGTVQVTDLMAVERYSHVMHLVSNIRCDLEDGCDAWDLLAATFPAGTLTGAPKVRAMEIIAELEDSPRGPYGGAVGYIAFGGNMDMAITIRTACVADGALTVRAGAGIVADSDPERERIETVNKAMAIQKALGLLQPHQGSERTCNDRHAR